MTLAVDCRIGLGHQIIFFAITGQIFNLVGYATVVHLPIRRFDKPEFIDPGKRRHRADETDVRAFRRFDRANASVMRWMHVADLESGAIAAQTTRPEGG